MQIDSSSSTNWLQKLQQDLQSLTADLSSAGAATQGLPSSGQNTQTCTQAAASLSSTGGTGSALLSSSALSWLINAQQASPTGQANAIIQSVGGGSSSLSLQQVASATGQSTDAIQAAFASIDTNGDGQISASELATALSQAEQQGQVSVPSFGHHHHHHHHGGVESTTNATDPSQTASIPTSGSSTTSSTTSTTTTDTTPTS